MDLETRDIPHSQEITEYVKQVVQHIKPKAIILYGSAATGTFGIGSDLDIMIIAEDLPRKFLDRLALLYGLNKSAAPIEPIAYTPGEIDKMMLKGQPALYDALEEGTTLFDDGFMKETRKTWENIKTEYGWTKTKNFWVKGRA